MPPFRLFWPPPEPIRPPHTDDPGGLNLGTRPVDADPAPAPGTPGRSASIRLRRRRFDDDPPTDPHGFPPIPAAVARGLAVVGRPRHPVEPPPDPREAAALAGAFAAD
jgi:hypothetical protein